MSRLATVAGLLLLGLLVIATGAWGALALSISGPSTPALRQGLAVAFGVASLAALAALAHRRWRWRGLALHAVLFSAVLAWFLFGLEPSNDRDWVSENAVLPRATIVGNIVTIHNVRNFSYRTETDFTPAYDDRRFDLDQLEGVDLVATYWMGPAVAHIFLSFAFADDRHLAISIETRKERGEGYSTVKGFFRQYELFYVVADERDVIGLRTNHRHDPPEQVYVYRLAGGTEGARRVFLDYMNAINALQARPAFYNSLTTNCTTTIWTHSLVNPGHVPFSWKILASGYVPEYLHEHGRLQDDGLPFEQLQQRARVNERAMLAGTADDFSRRIREPAP
jgi:Domain of unknown function (DUF4105)